MKTIALFFLLFFLFSANVLAEEIMLSRHLMESAHNPLFQQDDLSVKFARMLIPLFEDWRQTQDIKNHLGLYEQNPALGKHPSDSAVNRHFLAVIFSSWKVAQNLPEPWASSFLDSVRWTEELVTAQNQMMFSGRVRSGTIPVGIVLSFKF